MNILQAIKDEHLFLSFFNGELESWRQWGIALRCLYGHKIKSDKGRELVRQCTGRDPSTLPPAGFQTALFLCGRRSGKSRIASAIACFEALFGGYEQRLAKGETGVVACISPTKYQSSIVWKYLRALFDCSPMLREEVADEKESTQTFTLRNGISVATLVGDWRTIRGPSLVTAVIDECAFLGLSEESKVRSDTELLRALRPALITTKGRAIAISSKYSRKGWCYAQWLRYHGSNEGVSPSYSPAWKTLVWDSPSKTMNPTLPQAEIDAAFLEDPAAAASEFGGQWRDDVSQFIERTLVESLVARGRKELMPRATGTEYFGFSDLSGGRNDDAGLCIAHKVGRKVVLDFAKLWFAPFNPHSVIVEQAEELKRFGLRAVVGDNYAAAFVAEAFKSNGIGYTKSELPKSALYKELLPRLCSAEIELLDNERLVEQLASLERRTRSGGQDIIDHPPGAHDDLANVVAGVAACASKGKIRVGGWATAEAA